ncbi:MAG: 2-C-methyl-D-erythritol 2,4-cyclodiphosphate synthase [Clostridiales Family XIII bacterium]|jgi:2-C-methyl-D-erythritol 4-phosphate cytidylyltransferase/2-C-methyl-D-erythritol 2,4-cyclodiphosphate synthase|nr:2-C-methyl-D-erythritol 2,4-cyclodiphosphate synthase [Clostridiales Family XIII bacterium]
MYEQKRVAALIVAAGAGHRFGAGLPKQYLKIDGVPMLKMAAEACAESPSVDDVYVVASASHIGVCREMLTGTEKLRGVVIGGDTRQQSVRNGLTALAQGGADAFPVADVVLIHDGARPFVSVALIERVAALAARTGAVVPCVPVKDTICTVSDGLLADVPDRSLFRFVQTPQGFARGIITAAHERAERENFAATDDGTLVKRMGVAVYPVEGDYGNRKITIAADLPEETRIGGGFDVHAFAEGRKLMLGGVEIPHDRGLLGHSDADVVIHALMDAMLGALSLGDIGTHFPDTDEAYRGASGLRLLRAANELIGREGWAVGNADMTVIAEKPRLAPYTKAMENSVAEILGVPARCISVKATTTEGLGFTGRGEGMGAQAVVLLKKRKEKKA